MVEVGQKFQVTVPLTQEQCEILENNQPFNNVEITFAFVAGKFKLIEISKVDQNTQQVIQLKKETLVGGLWVDITQFHLQK